MPSLAFISLYGNFFLHYCTFFDYLGIAEASAVLCNDGYKLIVLDALGVDMSFYINYIIFKNKKLKTNLRMY